MKRLAAFLVAAIGMTGSAFGQSSPPRGDSTEARIVEPENAGWSAWKNRDRKWFVESTVAEAVWISSGGVTDKAQHLRDLATDREVKGVDRSDQRVAMKTSDLVIMTYTATQDAVCAGLKLPERIVASVVHVKRSGRWLEALHIETPLAK
ncbi:MAG: nuclear transport factor 2 family protein [Burkholderiaceae bacterium]|jgi:hypothetical protein|nr:nuclear transport factor 2 family protein [Burkholderiaceae bacterium]